MIKLSEDTQKIISFAVKYCDLVNINALLIDSKGIRARQDDTSVYLIEPGDYSFLEFDQLYINRIGSLAPRIKMFNTAKMDYELKASLKEKADGTNIVEKLIITGGKTTVQFATSILPKGKTLPTKVKDPKHYAITVESKDIRFLKKAVSAMGAETFKMYCKDGGVHCEITDIENDTLNQELSSEYSILDDDAPEMFELELHFKTIFPLLEEAARTDDEFEIVITRKGIVCLVINGLSMYIFPETD